MRLAAMFDRDRPPEELPGSAREVERLGLDELWVVEDLSWAGGLTAAAVALAATERLPVVLGIAPAPLRNPALLAMEAAALARLFPGRFTLGIGHGVQAWMEQVGVRAASPLTLLEELLVAVGGLLRGDEVHVDGRYVHVAGLRLVHPPAVAPRVLVGARRPRSLALAGRLADGAVLPEGTTPDDLPAARQALGRPDAQLAVLTHLVVGDRAVDGLLAELAAGADRPPDPSMAVTGDAATCAAAVRRWRDAGADALVLRPVGAGPEAQLRAVVRALSA